MPRPIKPARLWLRDGTDWIILDRGKQVRTGLKGPQGRVLAEKRLQEYVNTRPAPVDTTAVLTLREVLQEYLRVKQKECLSKLSLYYSVSALIEFWGEKTVLDVKGSTCRAYADWRKQPKTGLDGRTRCVSEGTIRRDLGVLQAALNFMHREDNRVPKVSVTLLGRSIPKDRFLTRAEAAVLLRASSPHLRRYILIALATGSRSSAILGLRWGHSEASGWIDMQRGVLHRSGVAEQQSNKRRGSVRVPQRLHSHLTRWERTGGSHVVQWNNSSCSSIKTAFAAACHRAGLKDVTPHTLKHTAVTWFFQRGGTIEDAADWFDTTPVTLLKFYKAHSVNHQERARAVMQGGMSKSARAFH